MAGAPFPLPPGASVPCRGQCRVVLCGGEGGRGWGAGCVGVAVGGSSPPLVLFFSGLSCCRSGGAGRLVAWWSLSPSPGRAPTPSYAPPLLFSSPWPVVCPFSRGVVCRRVRGVCPSRLSAAAWSWLPASSGWASSGWAKWYFGVLLVGPVGVAHGIGRLEGVVDLGVGGACLRGCAAVPPAFLRSAWMAGVCSLCAEGRSAVSYS